MFAIFCIAVQYFKSKYCSNNRVCRQYSYDGTRLKEDQADITDQDHQEKNTDTENTNSDKEQGTEESTDSDKIVTAYV